MLQDTVCVGFGVYDVDGCFIDMGRALEVRRDGRYSVDHERSG